MRFKNERATLAGRSIRTASRGDKHNLMILAAQSLPFVANLRNLRMRYGSPAVDRLLSELEERDMCWPINLVARMLHVREQAEYVCRQESA